MLNGHVTIKMTSMFTVKKLTAKIILDHGKSPRTGVHVLQKVYMFPRNYIIVSFIPPFMLLTMLPYKHVWFLAKFRRF